MNRNLRQGGGMLRTLFYVALFGSLGIAAFFLIVEHRAHIFGGAWSGPILFLVFVGLHVLMHLGHGGHGGRNRSAGGRGRPSQEDSDDER